MYVYDVQYIVLDMTHEIFLILISKTLASHIRESQVN